MPSGTIFKLNNLDYLLSTVQVCRNKNDNGVCEREYNLQRQTILAWLHDEEFI